MQTQNLNPAAEPLIDADALENLRSLRMEGEPDPLAELVNLFLNDTPKRLDLIRTALQNAVASDLEAAAHSLKGSASNLGACSIASSCARIMQLARTNDFGPVPAILHSLEQDFAKVKQALLEELKK